MDKNIHRDLIMKHCKIYMNHVLKIKMKSLNILYRIKFIKKVNQDGRFYVFFPINKIIS